MQKSTSNSKRTSRDETNAGHIVGVSIVSSEIPIFTAPVVFPNLTTTATPSSSSEQSNLKKSKHNEPDLALVKQYVQAERKKEGNYVRTREKLDILHLVSSLKEDQARQGNKYSGGNVFEKASKLLGRNIHTIRETWTEYGLQNQVKEAGPPSNKSARCTRIESKIDIVTKIGAFIRDRRLKRLRTTGKDVLRMLISDDVIPVADTRKVIKVNQYGSNYVKKFLFIIEYVLFHYRMNSLL